LYHSYQNGLITDLSNFNYHATKISQLEAQVAFLAEYASMQAVDPTHFDNIFKGIGKVIETIGETTVSIAEGLINNAGNAIGSIGKFLGKPLQFILNVCVIIAVIVCAGVGIYVLHKTGILNSLWAKCKSKSSSVKRRFKNRNTHNGPLEMRQISGSRSSINSHLNNTQETNCSEQASGSNFSSRPLPAIPTAPPRERLTKSNLRKDATKRRSDVRVSFHQDAHNSTAWDGHGSSIYDDAYVEVLSGDKSVKRQNQLVTPMTIEMQPTISHSLMRSDSARSSLCAGPRLPRQPEATKSQQKQKGRGGIHPNEWV
jgi:hypothetical protein